MKTGNRASIIANERGVLTLDFLFAISVALGFCVVFFAISYTLVMVEVTQYLAFSASRSYAGAHETPEQQKQLAMSKWLELRNSTVFKPILDMNWFVVGTPVFDDFSSEYNETADDNGIFVGARVSFESKVLDLNVPFLGRTKTDDKTGKATINSYLMREVTSKECRQNFTQARWEKIRALHPAYQRAPQNGQQLITDNGC